MRKNIFTGSTKIQDNGKQIKIAFDLKAGSQPEVLPLSVVENTLYNRKPAYSRAEELTANDLKTMQIAVKKAEERQRYLEANTIP